MTRTPVGTVHKARSDTALFAHVAWRLSGGDTAAVVRLTQALHVDIAELAIREAPKKAERLKEASNRKRAVRRGALVDYSALGFFQALVGLRPPADRDRAVKALERVSGVVELILLEDQVELFALVIYERVDDKRALRSRLGEHADVLSWRAVEQRRSDAAIATFRRLAREAASREGLRRK